jgi:hypothetical protein
MAVVAITTFGLVRAVGDVEERSRGEAMIRTKLRERAHARTARP